MEMEGRKEGGKINRRVEEESHSSAETREINELYHFLWNRIGGLSLAVKFNSYNNFTVER